MSTSKNSSLSIFSRFLKKNGIFLQKRQGSARRRVLTVSNGVVLGTTTPTTRLFATGTTTLRRTGTTTWASALFAPRSLLFNANAQNHIG